MADHPLILVVDDDAIILQVVSRLLTEKGYRVLTTPDGQAAWELLQGPPPLQADLMLTDVRMPHMGGAELGRIVGTSRPEIPVLYMTGFASTVETVKLAASIAFLKSSASAPVPMSSL